MKTATGLGRFQKNRGLKPDGLLNPKGPTIRKLAGEGGFAGKARAFRAARSRLCSKGPDTATCPPTCPTPGGGDDKGKAEVTDLLGQLEDVAPKAAGALRTQLAQKLAPAERGLLFAAAAIRRLAEDDEKPDDKPEKKPEKEPDKLEKPDLEKQEKPESESDAKDRCRDKYFAAINAWDKIKETKKKIEKPEAEIKAIKQEIEELKGQKGGSGIDEAPPIFKRPKGPMDVFKRTYDLAFWIINQQERQKKDLDDIDEVKAQTAKLEAEIKALETKVGELKERKKSEERHAVLVSESYDYCLKNPPQK